MKRQHQRGFSLVEVIIALGLLAGVLITIAGLFTIGGKQVKSGRTSTEALSIARGILEEMDGWGFRQTYELFGFDGTATSYTVNTGSNAYASKWHPSDAVLFNGYADIQIESLPGAGSPPPAALPLATTKSIRVTVTVHWDEGSRHRTVRLATVRM